MPNKFDPSVRSPQHPVASHNQSIATILFFPSGKNARQDRTSGEYLIKTAKDRVVKSRTADFSVHVFCFANRLTEHR